MVESAPHALQALVRTVVESLGYELVGVEFSSRGRGGSLLRVYIDSSEGITLDDCSKVSHQLSGVLDVEDPIPGNYDLEISSPGLDRPLFGREQLLRFQGHRAKIRLRAKHEGRRKVVGVLAGIQNDDLLIDEDGERRRIPLHLIETARLVPQF
jgi:ribosome maturation factor RimP